MLMKKIAACIIGVAILMVFSCASAPGTQKTYAYREQTVGISAGDYQIPAVLTMPVAAVEAGNSTRFPVVVMLHGFGSNKDEAGDGYKLFAPELAKNGIASVRIDFMGYGDSLVDHVNYDLDVGVSEAVAAANYASAIHLIDPQRIGVLGWSKGGTIAMLAAGRNPVFKSVVTWAGAPNLEVVYSQEGYRIAQRDGVYVETFDWRGPLNLSLKAFNVAAATDVLSVFSASRAPVLAINGSEDTVVLPENAARIKAASSNTASRLYEIPGADHTFNIFTGDMTAFNSLMAETIAWFLKTL